jgi:hypothetical protein
MERLCYELMWLKFGTDQQLLVKRFHMEFYEDRFKGLGPETRSQTDGHARYFSYCVKTPEDPGLNKSQ